MNYRVEYPNNPILSGYGLLSEKCFQNEDVLFILFGAKKASPSAKDENKNPYISSFVYCSNYWETGKTHCFPQFFGFVRMLHPFQSCHKMRRIKTNLYFKQTKSEEMRKCTDFKI